MLPSIPHTLAILIANVTILVFCDLLKEVDECKFHVCILFGL